MLLRPAPVPVWVWAAGALVVFLALTIGYSFTRRPWWNEGLFADVALHFRRFGYLGSSVLASHSYRDIPDVHRYTYWQFPLYLVSLGTWFHIAPGTVESMRIFSVLWGLVYLASWFLFVRRLTRDETLSLFVASVVALDYSCIAAASNGRMEMMCAALGQAALAAYVCLRDSHRTVALSLAGLLGAASLCCHPMGLVTNAFLAILLLRDWKRLSWSSLLTAGVPYAIAGVFWLSYILRAPQIFMAQLKANSGYRLSSVDAVFKNIANDSYTRYLPFYFSRLSGLSELKLFALLFGVVGMFAVAFNRQLRSNAFGNTILLFALLGYLGVAVMDNMKFPYYLIYTTPIFSACGAFWAYEQFRHGRKAGRLLAALLLVGFVTAAVAGFTRNIYKNDFAHEYRPAIAAVRQALKHTDIVFGPSEFAFELGFGPQLIDDCSFGLSAGIRPKVYVMHDCCGPSGANDLTWQRSRQVLATHYDQVDKFKNYTIYVRN